MWTIRRALAGLAALALVVGAASCSREPERSTDAFCKQVTSVEGLDQVLAGTDVARATQQVDQLRQLQQVSPTDIEPAVGRLVGIADEIAHALGTTPNAEAAANEVFRRHQSDLGAISDAGAQVERYALTNCDVRLNPTGTTVPATTAPAGATGGAARTTTAG